MNVDEFWERHYREFEVVEPSPFAFVVAEELLPTDTVIELGCGNGRDGPPLSQCVRRYVGIDSSGVAVERAKKNFLTAGIATDSTDLIHADFTQYDLHELARICESEDSRLVLYSRFTLHSVDAIAERRLFDHLAVLPCPSLAVFIEARTIYDELFGEGRKVDENAFETDHYRRFLDPRRFIGTLPDAFEINWLVVGRDFAQFQEENPIVLRTRLSREVTFAE